MQSLSVASSHVTVLSQGRKVSFFEVVCFVYEMCVFECIRTYGGRVLAHFVSRVPRSASVHASYFSGAPAQTGPTGREPSLKTKRSMDDTVQKTVETLFAGPPRDDVERKPLSFVNKRRLMTIVRAIKNENQSIKAKHLLLFNCDWLELTHRWHAGCGKPHGDRAAKTMGRWPAGLCKCPFREFKMPKVLLLGLALL